jgi:hypothetical protein
MAVTLDRGRRRAEMQAGGEEPWTSALELQDGGLDKTSATFGIHTLK